MTLPSAAAPAEYRHRLLRLGTVRGLCFILSDAVALLVAFLMATLPVLLFSKHQVDGTVADLLDANGPLRAPQMLAFAALLMIWFHHQGHYAQRLPFWTEVRHVVTGCVAALLADGFLQYATKVEFSRLWLVHTWFLSVPALLVLRRTLRQVLRAVGLWDVPALVVGAGARLEEVGHLLRSERSLGYVVVGVESLARIRESWPGSWLDVMRRCGAETVVLAGEEADLDENRAIVSRLALERLPFVSVRSLGGLPVIAVEAHHVVGHDVLLLSGQSPLLRPLGRAAKLLSDYVGGLVLLLLALPVFLVAVPLILRDGGPAIYAHTRVGRNGRTFRCLKFRTMVPDADAALAALLATDPDSRREWEATRKLRNDPRVTRVGAVLRAYSLDELPQLINVLRGEMSLVGPRPVAEEELERFGDDVTFYLETKPGLTGLWQVSGRGRLDYRRRIELNTWYVKNWSLWIDIVILLRTVATVLDRRGAY